MNRKATREQNDISIIIGNLPKRLQDKIIIREGSNATSNTASNSGSANVSTTYKDGSKDDDKRQAEDGHDGAVAMEGTSANGTHCATDANEVAVTSIDYFLRLATNSEDGERKCRKPVLETSGFVTTKPVTTQKTNTDTLPEDPQEIVSIPGLLRLNAENAKKLNETTATSNASRQHDRRNRHHQTRQEMLVSSARGDMPMSPVRQVQKLNHPQWFNALDDTHAKRLPPLFDALQQIISHNQVIENWKKLHIIRNELQEIFQHLLLKYLKFCCEQKVDSFFWKILFYNMREHLKQQQNETLAIKGIRIIIDEGIEFYDQLYKQLQQKYLTDAKTDASISLHNNDTATIQQQLLRSQNKLEFIAKVTAQKLLICLGDLWRYKIKDAQGQDYSKAEKYYQQAQAWVPSNGVPYNQLAIIAILNRKKFCAIYFHMRSLMSSNAIYSSKESLLVLFDEIRKKYEEIEMKSSPVHSNYHNNNQQASQSKSMRKEVWIYPDGMRRLHRTDLNGNSNYKMAVSEEKRFMDMPAEELLRRITSLYLYIVGKLFTGVGMETIVEHQRKLLLQMSVLLNYNKLATTRTRLIKMLALNIFVIEHNLNKDTRRYHAFNFCNQFFGLLLRKTNDLLNSLNNNPEEFEDENFLDLNTMLQYIRIYVLWLKHHINIWEPIKSEEHIYLNSWLELEKLFDLLKQENLTSISCQDIKFEEDIFLAGFTPLVSIIPKAKNLYISDECLQFKARLKIISEFQCCFKDNRYRLEGVEASQHFVYEILNSDIKQALDELQSTNELNVNDDDDDDNDDVDEDLENIVVNGESVSNGKKSTKSIKINANAMEENAQLSHLSKLKKELEAKSNVKKMYSRKLEFPYFQSNFLEILPECVSDTQLRESVKKQILKNYELGPLYIKDILKFVDSKLYIEVRPKYLLPDTNCFIDCLEDFERIVNEFKRYTLVIPLTVVKELDGLSKGVKVEPYQESMQKHRIHHYDDVSTRAKKSLDFIKSAKSYVKCATTKGSIISASLFGLVEEENVSNDDKILATALALSKTMSSETSKDGKCFIQTELVLITTDRNLRVKSLSRNLAVSELPEFIQWAKDCSN